ncbi:MAG: hypothetical protein R3301_18535, partial [Saprospiraceae bacterium]|nr:hypothetical protein [Saprospiraceae bacterium]
MSETPLSSDQQEGRYGLEPRQYERLYWEEDIPVKDITRGLGRWLFGIGLLLFAVIGVVSAVVKYPDQVELPFVLRSTGPEEIYKFPFAVYADELLVDAGQPVTSGQVLARITSPEIVRMINAVEGSESREGTFRTYGEAGFAQQQAALQREINAHRSRIAQLEEDLTLLEQSWIGTRTALEFAVDDARDRWHTAEQLLSDGVISRQDAQSAEKALKDAEDDLNAEEAAWRRERLDILTTIDELREKVTSLGILRTRIGLEMQE